MVLVAKHDDGDLEHRLHGARRERLRTERGRRCRSGRSNAVRAESAAQSQAPHAHPPVRELPELELLGGPGLELHERAAATRVDEEERR